MGVSNEMEPLYSVVDQLKILMAEGTATSMVIMENTSAEYVDMPMMNMWWAQTKKLNTAIATDEKATAVYPKTRLQEKHAMTSDIIPMPGRIITYTAGWE